MPALPHGLRTSLLLLVLFCLAAPTATAVLTKDQQKCQKKAAAKAKSFARSTMKHLARCHDQIATGKLAGGTDCRTEADTLARIAKSETKLNDGIAKACTDSVVASLAFGGNCFGAETVSELQACSLTAHETEVDRVIDVVYATAGVIASGTEKSCQKKASSQGRRLAGARLAKLQQCGAKVSKGSLPDGTECATEALTASKIAKVRDSAVAKIAASCDDATVALVPFGAPCDVSATGADLAECVASTAELSSGAWILAEYGTGIEGNAASAEQIADVSDCVEGPLSRCRVNDYLLENDQIRVVIQDLQRNISAVGLYGGQIIDADLNRGGAQEIDNFEEWAVAINFENTAHYTSISIVNDGTDGQAAIIRATGVDDLLDTLNPSSTVSSFGFPFPAAADDTDLPISIVTDYILEPGANYVQVETRVINEDNGSGYDIFFGEYLSGSGQIDLFLPGYGFGEPLVSTTCPPVGPNPCNAIVYRGIDDAADVSYGYVHDFAGSSAFNTSGVSVPQLGLEVTLALIGAAPQNFSLAAMGSPGDELLFTRYFIVGDGSVSSVLEARNEIQSLATGTISGTVEDASGTPLAGAEVAVLGDTADGPVGSGLIANTPLDFNVVSHTVTDANGNYQLDVAPGDYDVAVNREGHPYQGGLDDPALNPVSITANTDTTVDVTLPDAGSLQVDVVDAALSPLPAKVSVVGIDPSLDPMNAQSILGLINNNTGIFRERNQDGLPFGIAQITFVDPGGVSDTINLEPGSYEVYVSRGIEYSVDTHSVAVVANATTSVDAAIDRVIDSSGFVTGDFHVHSIDSPDSEVTRLERVINMTAEGVDFFTPTDHESRQDFMPIILANGWNGLVTSTSGSEITTFDYGHFNAWPMSIDPGQVNGGSVDHGGAVVTAGEDFPSFGNYSLTPGEIIGLAQADPGTNSVQINHIHSHFGLTGGSGLAIDTGLEPPASGVPSSVRRLDPAAADPSSGYFSDAFNSLEIWIGESRGQIDDNFLGRNAGDWFNLLNQGILRTGLADSDTHRRHLTQAGMPRSYIASVEQDTSLLDPEALAASVNSGRLVGTNSPMLRVSVEALTSATTASLESADPTLVSAADGEVRIDVDIQSPAWAEFDSIEFYLNSATVFSSSMVQSGAGLVPVARYGISPDFVLTEGVDFTVSTVNAAPGVPNGDRLVTTASLLLDGLANPALTEDTWIVVMVKGTDGISRPLFPMVPNSLNTAGNTTLADLIDGNLSEGGINALAFSNPLFVDVNDGAAGPPDGDYDAPGVQIAP